MSPPSIGTTASFAPEPSLGNPAESRAGRVAGATSYLKSLARWFGPGYLVAVGYMDPGNWATGITAGSAFGFQLLFVVLLSSVMAMLLQALAAKLGIVARLDLAQACRQRYGKPVTIGLWLLCEAAIVACDLAEVIGTAIALKLLFGLPLIGGILLTTFDVLLILALQRSSLRKLEVFVTALIITVAGCFAVELLMARPALASIAQGLAPQAAMIDNPAMLYLGIGIIGATVMPHNLYLHSSIVQGRVLDDGEASTRRAIRFANIDSTVALTVAFFVNAAILILAAAAFHDHGHRAVASIEDAYKLLAPLLGAGLASTLFAVALLASGQNATLTGTLAGQIVLEGFTDLRVPVWARRLFSRLIAVIPAAAVAVVYGDHATARLLVLSQVVLSLQLPFAIVPLIRITGDRRVMGSFANSRTVAALAWLIAASLIFLNLRLVLGSFR